MKYTFILLWLNIANLATAQVDRWQQRADYQMNIELDVAKNQFFGIQTITYFNNSPDTLSKVFFNLYYQAFQPNSMMDVRSRSLPDPDKRVGDRIFYLNENEIGYHHIIKMQHEGTTVNFSIEGTILTGVLNQPILPRSKTTFQLEFESQVPLQVRRTGRDNKEGIRYSMSQWFPKIAGYDYTGWHAYDYIGREFFSPWGNYDVTISLDESYKVAATGLLQASKTNKKGITTHRFLAENVHDFVWAADPDYKKKIVNIREGLDFHYYYQTDTLVTQWHSLAEYMKKAVPFIEARCGKYPYPVYKVIQGGDGGMEYPMATLITGHRSIQGLVGVTVHEFLHSWYQFVLATNESYFYWMDEGFNTFYDNMTMDYLFNPKYPADNVNEYAKYAYQTIVAKGTEEPLTTHADHFESNNAYAMAAYSKGALLLEHLSYMLGKKVFDRAMLRYYHAWKFKHPTAVDFEIIMEKESNMELSWYFDYWTKTTKTIDYSIESVERAESGITIRLKRIGKMPMPLDITITYKNQTVKNIHIPLSITRGSRELRADEILMSNWAWVNPYYTFNLGVDISNIKYIRIDPMKKMVDINYENNIYPTDKSSQEVKGVIVQNKN